NNPGGSKPTEIPRVMLTDHLNSVDMVVNFDNTLSAQESFDVFGQRRDETTWTVGSISDLTSDRNVTHHGFTGHEHLDHLGGLVHANGRVMDPVTGRFL